jgi:pilus assembly protein Flp/PilA
MTEFGVLKPWMVARFSKTEKGATMVEYVLLLALIAVVVIGIVTLIGTNANDKFKTACDAVKGAAC